MCYCMSAHIQCYLGGFLLQDAPSSLKQKFQGKIIIVCWQTKYLKLPQNQFLTEPKHGRWPQTMTSTIMDITESELNRSPLKSEPLMFVSRACRTTHVYYACSRQSIAFLANKIAELFVSPLFSPVKCIKICRHAALLCGPAVHSLHCVEDVALRWLDTVILINTLNKGNCIDPP